MKKWKQSLSKEYFYQLYELIENHSWILEKEKALEYLWAICDDDNKKHLIIDLLNRFQIIDEKNRYPLEIDIFNQILKIWKLPPEEVIFLPIADTTEIDGSLWILASLKQRLPNVFNPKMLLNNLMHCKNFLLCNENKHLVIVDDFIGSGSKLARKLKYVKENSICPNIYCVCPLGMDTGIKNLEEKFPDIKFFVSRRFEKAITDYYKDEADIQKAILKDITDCYKLKKQLHYLGFGQAEALVSYQDYNIPNNVFPIFWGESCNNLNTFFQRKK